jgi:peroxiredoxin
MFYGLVAAFGLLAAATLRGDTSDNGGKSTKPKLFDLAPRFELQDETGKNVSLDQFTGKIVVLEWFDPRNDYTRRDYKAGTTRTIAAKYREKGVVWLAINSTRSGDISANKKWREENKLGYQVLDDAHLTVASKYGITTAPFYFIIGKAGHIAYEGPLDEDENRALDQGPRDGRINYIDRALGQMTTGQQVDRPQPKVYGDPLNQ